MVSKALPSTKGASATKAKSNEKKKTKTEKTKSGKEKKPASTKKTNANAKEKLQQQRQTKAEKKSSAAAKGSKRPAATLAGGLANSSRLRMPGKPRLANSIAAAREAKGTPASMKTFLEQGKNPQSSTKKAKTVYVKADNKKMSGRPRTRNSVGGK